MLRNICLECQSCVAVLCVSSWFSCVMAALRDGVLRFAGSGSVRTAKKEEPEEFGVERLTDWDWGHGPAFGSLTAARSGCVPDW